MQPLPSVNALRQDNVAPIPTVHSPSLFPLHTMPAHSPHSQRPLQQPTAGHKHASLSSAIGDSDDEKSEQRVEAEADLMPFHHHHAVRIHDTQYVATLTLASSQQSFSLALHCPAAGRTHANTFTADYIRALTRKAQHPLSFAAFLALLSSALSSARPASSYSRASAGPDTAPSASPPAALDVLSPIDIEWIRSRTQHSSSISSPVDGSDSKRYLVLTLPTAASSGHVHLPLPLPSVQPPHHTAAPTTDSLAGPSAATQTTDAIATAAATATAVPSALSVLTATIAQLSRALKQARREARQERDSRRQREESDKRERDAMRSEIAWLKSKMGEHERNSSSDGGGSTEDRSIAGNVAALKARLQREERRRKEAEVLLAMWRTRCERAEEESARPRSARANRSASGSVGSKPSSSVISRMDGSQQAQRGRSRERPARLSLQRGASSRSVSPSYMRPTSSTAAKQYHSPLSAATSPPSPRSSTSLPSTASSRTASPRSQTAELHHSPTPPPAARRSAAHSSLPANVSRTTQRSTSPASTDQRQSHSASFALVTQLSARRRSLQSKPTAPSAPSSFSPALAPRSTSPSHRPPLHYQLPPGRTGELSHPPQSRDNSRSAEEGSRRQERPMVPLAERGPKYSEHDSDDNSERRTEHVESSGPQLQSLPTASPDSAFVGLSDVRTRLSALQRFLREEKSRVRI